MRHLPKLAVGPARRVAFWTVLLLAVGQMTASEDPPQPAAGADPFQGRPPGIPECQIDRLVFGQLEKLGIPSANLCSDGVFIRRVHLDVIGTLPTGLEARTFLLDPSPDKRRTLIDHLLERDEFADYWAMKWSDLLRVKAEFPINLWPNAAQAYHRWIRTRLKENAPYDRFVRELLTASGSNFRDPPANFYRAMQSREPAGMAQTVALTFMGARAERWPAPRLAGLAAFFSQVGFKSTGEWKEEIVFWDPGRATNGLAGTTVFPDARRRISPVTVIPAWYLPTGWSIRRIRGSRGTSPIASGPGCSAVALSRNRTISVRTIRPPTPNYSPIWSSRPLPRTMISRPCSA